MRTDPIHLYSICRCTFNVFSCLFSMYAHQQQAVAACHAVCFPRSRFFGFCNQNRAEPPHQSIYCFAGGNDLFGQTASYPNRRHFLFNRRLAASCSASCFASCYTGGSLWSGQFASCPNRRLPPVQQEAKRKAEQEAEQEVAIQK